MSAKARDYTRVISQIHEMTGADIHTLIRSSPPDGCIWVITDILVTRVPGASHDVGLLSIGPDTDAANSVWRAGFEDDAYASLSFSPKTPIALGPTDNNGKGHIFALGGTDDTFYVSLTAEAVSAEGLSYDSKTD